MSSGETSKEGNNNKTWMTSGRASFVLGCLTGVTLFGAASFVRRLASSFRSKPISGDVDTESTATATIEIDKGPKKSKSPETIDHIADKHDGSSLALLSQDAVYVKLDSETKVSRTCCYQSVPDSHIAFVTAINLLVEFLPNAILHILFSFLPPPPNDQYLHQWGNNSSQSNPNPLDEYLNNGWESNNAVLHDTPDIYVENVLPIKNQPSMIVTVGLPGSGKTTWAKVRLSNQLQAHPQHVIAADDYFDRFHGGEFDPSLLGKAHDWAQNSITHALQRGQSVVVNNTNTTLSEMHFYVCKAVFSNLPHKIVFAVMPETKLDILARRGVHGVPFKKLRDMRTRMQRWLLQRPPSVASVLRAGPFTRFQNRRSLAKHVVYTGVFVQVAAMTRIREYFAGVSKSRSLSPHLTDCHVTLKYKPSYADMDRLPFGETVSLKIVGYATHEHLQTLLVDILDPSVRAMCTNKYPHITVAHNRHHVGPQYSNELLEHGKVIPVVNHFDVNAVDASGYQQRYRHNTDNGGLIVQGMVGACYSYPEFGIYFEPPAPVQEQPRMRNQSQTVKVNVGGNRKPKNAWRMTEKKSSYSNVSTSANEQRKPRAEEKDDNDAMAMRFKQLMEQKIGQQPHPKQGDTRPTYKLQKMEKNSSSSINSNNNYKKKNRRQRNKKEYTVKKNTGNKQQEQLQQTQNEENQTKADVAAEEEEPDVNMNDIVIINTNRESSNDERMEPKEENGKRNSNKEEDKTAVDGVDTSIDVLVGDGSESNSIEASTIVSK